MTAAYKPRHAYLPVDLLRSNLSDGALAFYCLRLQIAHTELWNGKPFHEDVFDCTTSNKPPGSFPKAMGASRVSVWRWQRELETKNYLEFADGSWSIRECDTRQDVLDERYIFVRL